MYLVNIVTPDNVPDGYGGIDTEAFNAFLWNFFIIVLIISLFFYVIYLHCQVNKLKKNKIDE